MTYRPHKANKAERQRLREGMQKFREALKQDAKEVATRGSGLPKDWRSKILRGG